MFHCFWPITGIFLTEEVDADAVKHYSSYISFDSVTSAHYKMFDWSGLKTALLVLCKLTEVENW